MTTSGAGAGAEGVGERALVQVPVGHVAAGVAEDGDVFEEAGREVHPLLIDKEAGAAFAEAEGKAALVPPGEQPVALRRAAERNEAEVVGAVVEHVLLGRAPAVGDGRGDVRGEDGGGAGIKGGEDGSERAVDEDVGVEIDELFEAEAGEEMLQKRRFDVGVEFEDVVLHSFRAEIGEADRGEQHGLEGFGGEGGGIAEVGDEQDEEAMPGVPGEVRRGQGAGEGEIVGRDHRTCSNQAMNSRSVIGSGY